MARVGFVGAEQARADKGAIDQQRELCGELLGPGDTLQALGDVEQAASQRLHVAPRHLARRVLRLGELGRHVDLRATAVIRAGQLPVVAVGRSAAWLDATTAPSVPRRLAGLDDPVGLAQALAGCAVVINCAGPFLDTAAAVAQAALRAGAHCIDVTAEQASAQASFAELDAPARAAGRVVIPAAGFYGGLADLLASVLAAAGEIDGITVAMALDRWWPTAGTRKTGERNKAPRVVVSNGRLSPLAPSADPIDWVFSAPLGQQPMVELPLSEVITLNHHLKAGSIRSLLNRSALDDIHDASTTPPSAVDDSGRSAQRFELAVRLVQGGVTKLAGARGQDIYAVTAPIVIETALHVMTPSYRRSGVPALAEAVDPAELLRKLHGAALEVFGDALPG